MDPWGTSVAYWCHGEDVEVRSAGPDKLFNTADDTRTSHDQARRMNLTVFVIANVGAIVLVLLCVTLPDIERRRSGSPSDAPRDRQRAGAR